MRASKRESGSGTQTQDGTYLEVFDKEAPVFDIAADPPLFGCHITNKAGEVNHCDVTHAGLARKARARVRMLRRGRPWR